ncbi:MAG TPA: ZIP family metal transporter [Firmicutes bacterium]|nr:ZIP family metal transporter [Bacillota bacterium]
MNYIISLHPVLQGLCATLFTYFVTALGAALVFFFKSVNRKVLDAMLGFSAGVMIAASFWSLLEPSLSLAAELGYIEWLVPALGVLCGGGLIIGADRMLSRYSFQEVNFHSGNAQSLRRSILLVTAVTLHNIPEGLAVGVAFGGVAVGIPGCDLIGALVLAMGVGLQNFPEGASVSLPLRREGFSRKRSFFYGQLSGLVEPVAGVIGVVSALFIRPLLPFLLSFSAGAMIAVVASELIPESAQQNKRLSTLGVIAGFIIMMVLDVALG